MSTTRSRYLSKIERSPLFLLVDLHDSVMPLSDLGRLAEVCEPSVQVVALGERNDVGLFRSLLKIGVRDYLVKPLTVELLKRTRERFRGQGQPGDAGPRPARPSRSRERAAASA